MMPKPPDTDWPDDIADVRIMTNEEAGKIRHDQAPEPSPNDRAELKRQIDKDKKEKKRRW